MLPSLSPLSNNDTTPPGVGVAVPPPLSFRPIQGKLRNVHVAWQEYERGSGNSAAKMAGLRYEEKVQRRLRLLFPGILAAPRVEFRDDSGFRLCRPDALLPLRNRAIVFEIKSQHMPEAWWQLDQLYRPLIEQWCPEIPVQVIEIVRSFDPSMPFPCAVDLIPNLELWISAPETLAKFGVLVWRL